MNFLKTGAVLSVCFLLAGCGSVEKGEGSSDVNSSSDTEIAKGNYVYELKKKEKLKKEKYIVVEMNNFIVDESKHEPAPEDDYIVNFTIIPKDDASAVRGFKNSSMGEVKIVTEQDMKDAKQMIKDTEHKEQVKFTVAILPENDSINKKLVDKIAVGSEVTITGIHYAHSKILKNGVEEQLPICLQKLDVIRATELSVY